jgi:hypothetical protein
MAGALHGMYELTRHGMAGERHGHGMACVNSPLLFRNALRNKPMQTASITSAKNSVNVLWLHNTLTLSIIGLLCMTHVFLSTYFTSTSRDTSRIMQTAGSAT